MLPNIFGKLAEEDTEQAAEKWASKIKPFLAEMVSVVLLGAAKLAHEKLVHSIAQEKSLFRLTVFLGTNVRQNFSL